MASKYRKAWIALAREHADIARKLKASKRIKQAGPFKEVGRWSKREEKELKHHEKEARMWLALVKKDKANK